MIIWEVQLKSLIQPFFPIHVVVSSVQNLFFFHSCRDLYHNMVWGSINLLLIYQQKSLSVGPVFFYFGNICKTKADSSGLGLPVNQDLGLDCGDP